MSTPETGDTRRYRLRGDLETMATMARDAREMGLSVTYIDVHPTLNKEDFRKFLTSLWEFPSTWCYNFRSELIELGICNAEEFSAKFNPHT